MTTVAERALGPRILRSRSGLATVEAIPLLIIFVMLTGFAMGMWGSIHTAILYSISARTYAFETFRNRNNLVVFRENTIGTSNLLFLAEDGVRVHGIQSDENSKDDDSFLATRRPLSVGYPSPVVASKKQDHLERIFSLQPRNTTVGVGPIWVMVSYGICLDAGCGR